MSSFWGNLAPNDQAACFDPRSKPALDFGSKKAWSVQGPLQKGWNGQILPKIIEIAGYDHARAVIFKGLKDVSVTITWSCYLIGKQPILQNLQPTIIAKAGSESVAKNAAKYFQKLKDGSLRSLLGDFKLAHAKSKISLCGDEEASNSKPPEQYEEATLSEDRKTNLCGAHVRISFVNADSSLGDTGAWKETHATIGGVINIQGRYYGLTAAHVFQQPEGDKVPSPSTSTAREADSISWEGSRSLVGYVVTFDEGRQSSTGPFIGQSKIVNEEILSEGGSRSSSSSIICNWEKDWALIPVTNETFQTNNSVSLEPGLHVNVREIRDTIPRRDVIVVSGVSGCRTTSFEPSASAILLPASQRIQLTWCLRCNSLPGDCGSWVIDERGRAYAMIVATNSQSNETFCIPLSSIMAGIQDFLGLMYLPEIPLNEAERTSMVDSLGDYDDSDEADDVRSEVEELEIVEPQPENGGFTLRDKYLNDENISKPDIESQNRGRPPHMPSTTKKAVRSSVVIDGKAFNLHKITSADISEITRDQLLSDHNTYLLIKTPSIASDGDDTSISPGTENRRSRKKQADSDIHEEDIEAGHIEASEASDRARPKEPVHQFKVPEEPLDPEKMTVAIASRNLDHQFEASLRDLLMEAGCDVQLARDIMKAHSEKEEEIRQSSLALPKRAGVRKRSEPPKRGSLGKSRDGLDNHERGPHLKERAKDEDKRASTQHFETTTKPATSFALGGVEVDRRDEDRLPDKGSKLKEKRLVYDRASSHLAYA